MTPILEPAPNWQDILRKSDFLKITEITQSGQFLQLSEKANNKDYLYWDRFKQVCKISGISPEQGWAYIRLGRNSVMKHIPLIDMKKRRFGYWMPDGLYRKLHEFEHTSSEILFKNPDVSAEEKERFLISSLMEEAIASSQIEGASTTREVAKEMLRSGRKPNNHPEWMIYNNYRTIVELKRSRGRPLSIEFLYEIHRSMTENTLESPDACGRFRNEMEIVHVVDNATGEVLHQPPPAEELTKRIQILCNYANSQEDHGFVHPIIKAVILHFWLAYVHPFVDGNGRTARALFYWYMLKSGYWLVEYISISRAIKQTLGQYKKAYLYAEHDEQDMTYFLFYHLEMIHRGLEDLKAYMARKSKELQEATKLLVRYPNLNHRQSKLIYTALTHPTTQFTIETHKNTWGVTYETARTDLQRLEKKRLLIKNKKGQIFYYLPPEDLKERLRIQEA